MKHAKVVVSTKIDKENQSVTMRLIDDENREIIATIPLRYEDFVDMGIKSTHSIDADAEFCDWYKIGKRRIIKTMKFEMPACHYLDREQIAMDVASANCPKGWSILIKGDHKKQFVFDYRNAGGNYYATTSICKYAPPGEIEKETQSAGVAS